jgi:hypothetical protein
VICVRWARLIVSARVAVIGIVPTAQLAVALGDVPAMG